MTLAILIILIVCITVHIGIMVTKWENKYGGYYYITYSTQKRNGIPIYHHAIIKGPPVDWILNKGKADKSIYYRLLYADGDNKYKDMSLQTWGV